MRNPDSILGISRSILLSYGAAWGGDLGEKSRVGKVAAQLLAWAHIKYTANVALLILFFAVLNYWNLLGWNLWTLLQID